MRYGVVQVQVDLQVGQRPAETFFQIRGEERMEKVPANEEKEERTTRAGGRERGGRRRARRARGAREREREKEGRGRGGDRELTSLIHLLVAFPVYILLTDHRPGTTAFKVLGRRTRFSANVTRDE